MSADESNPSHSLLCIEEKFHSFPASPSSSPESSRDPSLSIPSTELHTARSLPSLPTHSNGSTVKFAPLPVAEKPRSRHPSFQYGVGSRSQILRNRRLMQEMQAAAERGETIYVTDGGETVTVSTISSPTKEEDPVIVLGRRMADVSRSLWRKVARKHEVVSPVDSEQNVDNEAAVEVKQVHLIHQSPRERHPDTQEKVEEGRAWEEEIDLELYRRLSIIRSEESEGGVNSDSEIPDEKSQVQALGKKDIPQRKEMRRTATR
ncbi:hypothetical protein OE88DRAFT_1731999 [Heliocybe sulcata]|uniref:Uncharacterized protein n=1 Tax=Heliocybe sulcata TaxID=5364 RepID=A0A5C3NCT8_9AGAM|nr:hypothetical protein OE88DRAFT_1731999 [Heliocybe sulcata]